MQQNTKIVGAPFCMLKHNSDNIYCFLDLTLFCKSCALLKALKNSVFGGVQLCGPQIVNSLSETPSVFSAFFEETKG